MATPPEKLAQSLKTLGKLHLRHGGAAILAQALTRTHRERLLANGFLQQVIKGWYIPSRPDEPAGESTAWYASFWRFCTAYLNERFDAKWCLLPEQSLSFQAGNRSVPRQLLVRSPKVRNRVTNLPHGTSLLTMIFWNWRQDGHYRDTALLFNTYLLFTAEALSNEMPIMVSHHACQMAAHTRDSSGSAVSLHPFKSALVPVK